MVRDAPAPTVRRLAAELFGGVTGDLVLETIGWLADSPRFRRFVEANQDKIRKKLRGAKEPEARRDVRAELRVAHLLSADRRIELAFEAYGSGRVGPDFTVGYGGRTSFNLEVTRIRRTADAAGVEATVLAKLRQLPPSVPNAVLVAVDGLDADAIDIGAIDRSIRAQADARDPSFLSRYGFEGSRAFYHRYHRLGAVIIWSERMDGEARAAWWVNRSAGMAVPEPALRACVRCLRPA
jgi:hypothetical protein